MSTTWYRIYNYKNYLHLQGARFNILKMYTWFPCGAMGDWAERGLHSGPLLAGGKDGGGA